MSWGQFWVWLSGAIFGAALTLFITAWVVIHYEQEEEDDDGGTTP